MHGMCVCFGSDCDGAMRWAFVGVGGSPCALSVLGLDTIYASILSGLEDKRQEDGGPHVNWDQRDLRVTV